MTLDSMMIWIVGWNSVSGTDVQMRLHIPVQEETSHRVGPFY